MGENKMSTVREEIQTLKKEKNAVILAHYYVPDEVQECADYIGDSFYLSKKAKETDADIIVFAGVAFMGESACCCRIRPPTARWHTWQIWKLFTGCVRLTRISR